MSALVVMVAEIVKHPNADRLEILRLVDCDENGSIRNEANVVVGLHYRQGQLGVYVPPGSVIPGHLAVESWLVGKRKIDQPYTVLSKNMRGIDSPGLFMGQWYCKDKNDLRSIERFQMQVDAGMEPNLMRLDYGEEWIKWRYWRDEWQLGQDVSADLGIKPA